MAPKPPLQAESIEAVGLAALDAPGSTLTGYHLLPSVGPMRVPEAPFFGSCMSQLLDKPTIRPTDAKPV